MAYSLRWYQSEAVSRLFAYLQEKSGAPIICAATGSGKSLIIAAIICEALRLFFETRIIVLSHVKEILSQDHEKLMQIMPHAPAGIFSASLKKRQFIHPIIFGGIHSVYDKAHLFGKRHLLIIDECFTGDTMVMTPNGEKRIDSIKSGDIVLNACGQGTVLMTRCSLPTQLIKLELSNGRSIKCTPNHPFFAETGWREARKLEKHSSLFSEEAVRILRERFFTVGKKNLGRADHKVVSRKNMEQDEILYNILREETQEPHERQCLQNENEGHIAPHKTCSNQAWRQREIVASSATCFIACAWRGVARRICSEDSCGASEWRISKLLQGGHSKRREKNSDRDKWRESLYYRKASAGQEERRSLGDIRVENISHIKREGNEPVFNLCVSGHPSYFANGVLVHNCHMVQGKNLGMYGRFISDLKAINPKMRVIGLTATDYRLGRGLLTEGDEKIFDDVVYEITIPTLIDEGYLTPPVGKHLVTQADMTGVKMLGSDYNQKQMAERFSKLEFIEAVIKEDLPYFEGRKTIALFCPTIEIADHVAQCMVSHGIPCEAMHGDMTDEDISNKDDIRADKLRRFKSGELRALASVGMLTVGTDIPNMDCLVLLFATQSPGLLAQVIGRGFRVVYADGYPQDTKEQRKAAIAAGPKPNFLCLDHGGNLERHGGVADIQKPQQKKKGQKKAAPKAKHKVCEICRTSNTLEALTCIICGSTLKIERDPTSNLSIEASNADIMGTPFSRGEAAEWFDVDDVKYSRHVKADKSESLRITYYSGILQFDEWKTIAWIAPWWRERSILPTPYTVHDALKRIETLKKPKRVQVRKKGKYHEILRYEFNEAVQPGAISQSA